MDFKFSSKATFIALIVAFLFHNMEEAITICRSPVQSPFSFIRPADCNQFVVAVSIITFIVIIACITALRSNKPAVYLLISTAIASGLVLNVLIPHIFTAIYTFKYTPGLITAVLLNLPLGIILLIQNRSTCKSYKQFYQYMGIGLFSGYLLFAAVMGLVLHFIQ